MSKIIATLEQVGIGTKPMQVLMETPMSTGMAFKLYSLAQKLDVALNFAKDKIAAVKSNDSLSDEEKQVKIVDILTTKIELNFEKIPFDELCSAIEGDGVITPGTLRDLMWIFAETSAEDCFKTV